MYSRTADGTPLPREVALVSRPGMTPEEVAQEYNKWSKDAKYEKDMIACGFKAPTFTAAAVAHYLPAKKDVRILDVGAGTGLVASQLHKLGFNRIDALDASEGMLDVARGKGLYQHYFCVFFDGQVNAIETSTYDVLVCSAALVGEHLKCDCLAEMVRIVKKGGLVVMVLKELSLSMVAEFKDRLEPYMKQLEAEGQWVLLERTIFPGYVSGENGARFVFRITKREKMDGSNQML